MTESDFWKTYFSGRKCRKYAGKTCYLAFSRDFIISFLIFCLKMRISNVQNVAKSDSSIFFFRPKIPEICRTSPFLQIFIGLFPYVSLFFPIKTSLITMPTIKHDSIVNKTDFCSRNFLKLAETGRNSRLFVGKHFFAVISFECTLVRTFIIR